MAPEVLRGTEEYDFTVDYWSLGCMLYEALAGYPPFAGATVEETWHNLKHWKKVLHKPEYENPNYYLSKRTWDLIIHLVAARESRFQDFKSVQAHAYFSEVNWADLRGKEPPFVPELDSETDAGYFDDFSNEADMAKYKEVHDKQTALENMEERKDAMSKVAFVGFTFKYVFFSFFNQPWLLTDVDTKNRTSTALWIMQTREMDSSEPSSKAYDITGDGSNG
jgi:cell cycle protein kinase DBF2